MLDQADLDFGIYRIMNTKRDEITRFLDNDLLPQVRDALGTLEDAGRGAARQEMDALVKTLTDAGMDPEQSPKVRELRVRFGAGADPAAAEAEVFSHLYQLFRRYYHKGDFLSLRRYKEGFYAIPCEGEEVKLNSFIVSQTPHPQVGWWDGGMSEAEFAARNVLFRNGAGVLDLWRLFQPVLTSG